MRNAKEELISILGDKLNEIKCARLTRDYTFDDSDDVSYIELKQGYTPINLDLFLSELDFNYDNGYGGQELFGTVWLNNGVWLERGEYDGSEWWEIKEYPIIPAELISDQQ